MKSDSTEVLPVEEWPHGNKTIPSNNVVQLTLKCPAWLKTKLDEEAADLDMSTPDLHRKILCEHYDRDYRKWYD
jgi:hypothetical protein